MVLLVEPVKEETVILVILITVITEILIIVELEEVQEEQPPCPRKPPSVDQQQQPHVPLKLGDLLLFHVILYNLIILLLSVI